LEVMVY